MLNKRLPFMSWLGWLIALFITYWFLSDMLRVFAKC